MANNRDNFTRATVEILSKRVGFLCSNPDCRKHTIGPNEKKDKSTTIGVAAHITAASEGGPRYDTSFTNEKRRHIDNGIWLCSNCATLIDKDPIKYPIEKLRKWKEEAEEECGIKLSGKKSKIVAGAPYLEVDLIRSTSGRSNSRYSNKNPVRDHQGTAVIDISHDPIIHWKLFWDFNFMIYNNSQNPAYNIKIESIGEIHFTQMDNLPQVNNLRPLENLDLKVKYEDYVEGTFKIADGLLKPRIPEKFKNLLLRLTYYDDNREIYTHKIGFSEKGIMNKRL